MPSGTPKWSSRQMVTRTIELQYSNYTLEQLIEMAPKKKARRYVDVVLVMNGDYAEDCEHIELQWLEPETDEEMLIRISQEKKRRSTVRKKARERKRRLLSKELDDQMPIIIEDQVLKARR